MVNKFGMIERWAGSIPSLVPLGTILLTPIFGSLYDRKGKGASIMILGSLLLILVHLTLFLPAITSVAVAAIAIIIMGVAFSLVPSAMWPSVPKIIPEKQLGSAYAVIFWLQNLGAFWAFPLAIGVLLDRTNPGVFEAKQAGEAAVYDYTATWSIFVGVAVLALVFAFLLKAEDKRKGYGLEKPNIQK
jgi:MFS family permease